MLRERAKQKAYNPHSLIGKETNGIKILNVYLRDSGGWGAQVRCSCGRIFKTNLSSAIEMNKCPHVFRKWRK